MWFLLHPGVTEMWKWVLYKFCSSHTAIAAAAVTNTDDDYYDDDDYNNNNNNNNNNSNRYIDISLLLH